MRKSFFCLCLVSLSFLFQCQGIVDQTQPPSGNAFTKIVAFSFLKSANEEILLKDETAIIDGNKINVCIPYITDFSRLKATFTFQNSQVFVNEVEQVSGETCNNFTSEVTYKVVTLDGKESEYVVTVTNSGLPVLEITTPSFVTIESKDIWVENTSVSITSHANETLYTGNTSIKGRGNSTWKYPKKPYALKLDSKASLFGMPKNKRWVLLANYLDHTLLRNRVAFQIAKLTDLDWTPSGEYVELVLNGQYKGNYYLCEQIRIDENRVNINEMNVDDTEGDAITGGYLLELDNSFDEVNKFYSAYASLPVMFKEPDEDAINPQQINYLKDYVNSLEASLYNSTRLANREYTAYLDVDSFIDWWFVHELTMNREPHGPKSVYMYKDKLGKLKAGPVWDFDWNTFTTSFFGMSNSIKSAVWYGKLFQDPVFVERVKERWQLLKPGFETIESYIDAEAVRIKTSAEVNIELWPIGVVVNRDETLSFDDAVSRMKKNYQDRLLWLDEDITKM